MGALGLCRDQLGVVALEPEAAGYERARFSPSEADFRPLDDNECRDGRVVTDRNHEGKPPSDVEAEKTAKEMSSVRSINR